jgi:pimeloyl-ACP methyl ester carboxylesterase
MDQHLCGPMERIVLANTRLALQRHSVAASPKSHTLVFLHDSLGCITTWREFPKELSASLGLDSVVYDRQGYGRSQAMGPEPRGLDYMHREADVLTALLEQLGIEQAILFGHSDGGTIALLAAARHPQRIAAVITEGAHVFVEEVTLQGIELARQLYATTDLPARLQRHHGERTEALVQAWIATWSAPFFRGWDITEDIAPVRCPALVLQGVDDEYGTVAQVQAIAASVSGPVQVHMIPGAAHSPHKEAPEVVLDLVVRFVADAI